MWTSIYRDMYYRNECLENSLEKYKVGDWLKKTHEKIDREKEKIQREKKRVDRESDRRMRREERTERAIAASKEIFWEDLRKAQEKYREKNAEKKEKLREIKKSEEKEKESEKNVELREKEIENEDVILDSCLNPNLFPNCDDLITKKVDDIPKEACKKEDEEVLPNTQSSASTELQEINISKLWNTTTLIPSSKLVCVVKCWDSSNSIHLPTISFIGHENNKVNEEECSLGVDAFCELGKYDYVFESKGNAGQTNHSNELAYFSKVKNIYDGFFRLVFDPGGIRANNSRSNSLEEEGNDIAT